MQLSLRFSDQITIFRGKSIFADLAVASKTRGISVTFRISGYHVYGRTSEGGTPTWPRGLDQRRVWDTRLRLPRRNSRVWPPQARKHACRARGTHLPPRIDSILVLGTLPPSLLPRNSSLAPSSPASVTLRAEPTSSFTYAPANPSFAIPPSTHPVI